MASIIAASVARYMRWFVMSEKGYRKRADVFALLAAYM